MAGRGGTGPLRPLREGGKGGEKKTRSQDVLEPVGTPVTLATEEVEIRRIKVGSQQEQIV
jgi:hypothetical protein